MTENELRNVLGERIAAVRARITQACLRSERDPADVTLVAVTKTVSPQVAAVAAELGLTELGESKPQELWKKAPVVTNVNWHLVGHLQRNKIDRTVPLVSLIPFIGFRRIPTWRVQVISASAFLKSQQPRRRKSKRAASPP